MVFLDLQKKVNTTRGAMGNLVSCARPQGKRIKSNYFSKEEVLDREVSWIWSWLVGGGGGGGDGWREALLAQEEFTCQCAVLWPRVNNCLL